MLPEEPRKVIRYNWGLEDGIIRSPVETGKLISYTSKRTGRQVYLTREGVRQREAKGLKMLRHPSRSMRIIKAMDDPTLLEYFRSREYGMHARERTLLGLRRQLGIEDSEE